MSATPLTLSGVFHKRPRRADWRSASQLASTAGAKIGDRPFSEPVQSARLGVLLDRFVEAGSIERFEPRPELGQLIRRQFSERLFNILDRFYV